jgi:hypothetical protein
MKSWLRFHLLFVALGLWSSGGNLVHAAESGRHALIICNQNYIKVGELRTTLAEAREAEKTLASLGFAGNITVVTDATTAKMIEAVDDFTAKLGDAKVALFFYGGHAIQAAGENYLLGVDSDPATTSQLAYKALPLGRVLTNLEGSSAHLNLLILDCCRDNPLPTRGRNVGSTRGLAPTASAPKGTFIAYAADANQQAWDDHGQIGLYGSVLFEKMKTPGLRLEDIFIQTREQVATLARDKYQHQQEPAEYSKVSGAFYFVPVAIVPPPPAVSPNRLSTIPANTASSSLQSLPTISNIATAPSSVISGPNSAQLNPVDPFAVGGHWKGVFRDRNGIILGNTEFDILERKNSFFKGISQFELGNGVKNVQKFTASENTDGTLSVSVWDNNSPNDEYATWLLSLNGKKLIGTWSNKGIHGGALFYEYQVKK